MAEIDIDWLANVFNYGFLSCVLTWQVLVEKTGIWRQMLIAAWFGFMTILISPYAACGCFFVALFPFIIFGLEVAVDELINFKHRLDTPLRIGEIKEFCWQRVAAARSSNGYDSDQFYPAMVCDFGPDDSFWPDHVSTVYLIEHRRRCLVWRTFTIWRVSLLNGGMKKVHEFNDVSPVTDEKPFARQCGYAHEEIRCCQSRGVLFLTFRASRESDSASVFVYDTKYQKSAVYTMRLPGLDFPRFTISVSCSQRLFNVDGSVRGWRVRWIDTTWVGSEFSESRACLINEIYDLQENGQLISSEDVVYGRYVEVLQTVRTSRGYLGVMASQDTSTSPTTDGPIMIFDETAKAYVYFVNIADLRRKDARCTSYAFLPRSMAPLGLSLAIINDREVVRCYPNGSVFRAEFRPSTLKYSAAKAFFRSNPGFRNRVTADEFRRLTGIEGMDGHFG